MAHKIPFLYRMIFSLKRLQVIDLITNQEIFSKLNISVPNDDFLDVINEFGKEFNEYFSIVFYWLGEYQQYVSEVLTQWGLCFTFNIAFSHDLLDLNSTSSDFHYLHTHREIQPKLWRHQHPPIESPKKLSTSNAGLWTGFSYYSNFYKIMLHNPFELPSSRSKMLAFNPTYKTKISLDPQLYSIDESLHDLSPAE